MCNPFGYMDVFRHPNPRDLHTSRANHGRVAHYSVKVQKRVLPSGMRRKAAAHAFDIKGLRALVRRWQGVKPEGRDGFGKADRVSPSLAQTAN